MRILSAMLVALAIGVCGSAASADSCESKAIKTATASTPRTDATLIDEFIQQRHDLPFAMDFLLIGDSHTTHWPLVQISNAFPGTLSFKFAIGGDKTQNLVYRIDHTDFTGHVPKYVILSIGSNNIAAGEPACAVAYAFNSIYQRLRSRFPFAYFLFLEPPPRGPFQTDNELARQDYATRVKRIADADRHLNFLRLPDRVTDCGAYARAYAKAHGGNAPGEGFCPAMEPDFVHMSTISYQVLTNALKHAVD